MSIDNTYTFSLTRNQIIQRALELIGASGVGDIITADDQLFTNDMLNSLLKSWDAMGLHLWKTTEAVLLIPTQTQYLYKLGPGSSDDQTSETVVYTTVTTAVSSGVNTVVVASVTGINVNDNIVLVYDGNATTLSTTITGINTGTKTLTLTANTGSTAAIGQAVFTYTSKIQKPMELFDVRRMDTTGNEVQLTMMGSSEYFNLPNKTSVGLPTSYYYEPKVTDGYLYLWPQPSDPTMRVTFRYSKQLSDLIIATDTPDIPQEFYLALVYNLAVAIAPAYGRLQELQILMPLAGQYLEMIKEWDIEHNHLLFKPDLFSYNN